MRRKMILALMLAIVSSAWMKSKAMCQVDGCTCLFEDPPVAISGILQLVPFPCPESTEDIPCPPCLTITLNTNEQLYYLHIGNDNLNALLDTLVYPVNATVTGNVFTPYEEGLAEEGLAIRVLDISLHASLPSLCDEWNILEVSNVTCGDCEVYRTYHSQLTKDTIINGKVYAQLIEDGAYRAALREGNKRDVYCIPAGSTHEYLLYDFDVQAGDQLENLWLGGMPEDYPNGWTMTVEEIQEGTPRTFVLSTGFIHTDEGVENYPLYITWIEGVGLTDGPIGVKRCVGCADSRGYGVLCAYKNGEQIYTSNFGEQYGCVYNYDPFAPVDTIPLYAQDDPGSSTVDPVDPNQLVATLKGNQLTIHENMGTDITYTLQRNAPAQAPAIHNAPKSDTFRDEVTIQITESGEYLLQLTNPSWDYIIYGQFYYAPQGIETLHPASAPQKVLIDGQIYILRGDIVYTIDGREVK